jgi:hypothetical protein
MPTPNRLPLNYGVKPLQKCVDVKLIRDWVSPQARVRIDLTQAWTIIKDQFCAAVYARGVCPIQCERCREQIVDLFRLEQATNPEALLTWLAKDHAAKWIEKLIAAEKEQDFPTQETLQTQLSDEQLYHGLFPVEKAIDIYEELLRFYGTSEDDEGK